MNDSNASFICIDKNTCPGQKYFWPEKAVSRAPLATPAQKEMVHARLSGTKKGVSSSGIFSSSQYTEPVSAPCSQSEAA